MNLHELQVWIRGFAAASTKRGSVGTAITNEQWTTVQKMIMEAKDASTEKAGKPAAETKR